MKLYKLEQKQFLLLGIDQTWEFFSNPANLEKITPKNMNFNILTELPEEIYQGLLIEYTVTPIANISVKWVTEITAVDKPNFFIDEQRFGPYKFWYHQHFFKQVENGVEMTDIVNYALPFGLFGNLAYSLFVKKKLNSIFSYRKNFLKDYFIK